MPRMQTSGLAGLMTRWGGFCGRTGIPIVRRVERRTNVGRSETTCRNAAIHRSYAAMLGMYLDLAGLPISERSRLALESAGSSG